MRRIVRAHCLVAGMDHRCLAVFTTETPVRILREGGSRGWIVNPDRASVQQYLVCVHNHAHPAGRVPGSVIQHKAAFLIGRISDVVPSPGDNRPRRFKICITEFHRYIVPDCWRRWCNPVKYTSLGEIGINPDELDFHSVTEAQFHIRRLTEQAERRAQGSPPAHYIPATSLDR